MLRLVKIKLRRTNGIMKHETADCVKSSLVMAVVLFLITGSIAASDQESGSHPCSATHTWDAAAEFSATDNPSGVWTYAFGRDGLEMKGDGTQTGLFVMNMRGPRFDKPGIMGWKGTPYPDEDPEIHLHKGNRENWCVVAKNVTDSDIDNIKQYGWLPGWTAPTGKLILNSCNDKHGSATRNIVQFKAPHAGKYTFRVVWTALNKQPYVDISCLIYEKGCRNLYDGEYLGGRIYSDNNWEPCIATHTVNLKANDTIWFCNQNNKRYVTDNPLSLELTVTRSDRDTAAVPITADTSLLADKGQVVVNIDISEIFPMGQGTLEASLRSANDNSEVREKTIWPVAAKTRLSFSMLGLAEGDYVVTVTARDEESKEIGKSAETKFSWKEPTAPFVKIPGMKVLNNLVIELHNSKNLSSEKGQEITFTNPYEGWVFFSCTAKMADEDKVTITVNDGSESKVIIVQDDIGEKTTEAMRYLPKGSHRVRIACDGQPTLERFVIRAIPELIYTQFNENPRITEYGPYDWYYLQKHIFKNINAMTTLERALKPQWASNDITQIYRERMEWWKDQGKKWIFCIGMPGKDDVERIYKELYYYAGYQHRFSDGIIVDEFAGATNDGLTNDSGTNYLDWAKVVDKIYQDPKLKKKKFYIYTYGAPMVVGTSKVFAETLIKHNGNIVLEWYPSEQSDLRNLAANLSHFRSSIAETYVKNLPGAIRHLIPNIGYVSNDLKWTCDTDALVDFKVHMDMFMNLFANDPAFFSLYGVTWYSAMGADEEIIRWGSRLFRHYCIEGKTTLLSNEFGYKYHLAHIINPEFDQNQFGWDITKAEDGDVSTKSLEGYGFLQGRGTERVNAAGDSFAWTKRGARKPNTLAQNITNLIPGRLYSIKLITADYQNFLNGKSQYEKHAVSIRIDNADIVEKKSFQQVICPDFDMVAARKRKFFPFPKFNSYDPVWLNLHQKIFRAKGKQARLIISDWLNDKEPGGPIGQELMYNFVQIQPYYDED